MSKRIKTYINGKYNNTSIEVEKGIYKLRGKDIYWSSTKDTPKRVNIQVKST